MHKLLLSFTVISDVYKSFIPNKGIFTKYWLIQWISKLPGSFEIHWVRQYLVNFHRSCSRSKHNCLPDGANYDSSQSWQIVLIFNAV